MEACPLRGSTARRENAGRLDACCEGCLREIVATYYEAKIIDIAASIRDGAEFRSTNHFDRIVYHRLYMAICEDIERCTKVSNPAVQTAQVADSENGA
jgi:hypothetical protein